MNVRKSVQKITGNFKNFFVGSSLPISSVWGWSLPGQWSRNQLIKQYARYVYAIISAIAEESAKIDFEMYLKSASKESPALNHDFLKLMKKPNPESSQFQFLEMHFTFMKIFGESFWYLAKGVKSKMPKELFLLRPDMVEVESGKTLENGDENKRGLVTNYKLNKSGGGHENFKPEEILHFKMPNPSDPHRGLGTIQAAKLYIETEQFASRWTRNSIYNSGRPSGVLNIKGMVDGPQFDKLKKQFKENYSGTENAGKTMLLRGADGLNYQKLGMEIGEVALKEMKDMTRDDIMVMFRVSKTILGITDDVNRANAREAKGVFIENVIKPELDRFIDHLNAFLIPQWPGNNILKYKDPTLINEKDKVEEWNLGFNKWLTRNDIRRERGLDPVQGGDIFYEQISMIPVTSAPSGKGLKKKEIDRHSRGEIFRLTLYKNQEQWERLYKKAVREEFETQREEILKNNKKKRSVKKAFEEWLFNALASKARLLGVLTPITLDLINQQAKLALEMADDDQTKFQLNKRVRDYVHDRIDKLADATNDFTIKKIEDTIGHGIQEGESISQLVKRINEVYFEASTTRAERIARTETIAVSNDAANEAYLQSPLVVSKEWHTEIDGCDFCQAMNGMVVGKTETFLENGQSVSAGDKEFEVDYGNVEFPPLHPNCKCAILPVAGE